jgi:glyoxylase-like metal-dependent hydrolase (beta-lactamase superfamily II)
MKQPALHFDQSLPAVYGVAERLSPRIERVLAPNPSPFTFRGTGVYLVGDQRSVGESRSDQRSVGESRSDQQGSVAVIDPGPDDPTHIEALLAAIGDRKVAHILVTHTHRDHSPAARRLKERTGALLYAYGSHPRHAGDAEEGGDRDFVPDVMVRDGDVIAGAGYTFECVFTPGHTSNHMCYALTEEAALFTGDHVMGWSTSVIAPPDGDMGAYMQSLEKLIARADRILYPTHGSPITRPRPFLRAYLAHRRMRETQIARALGRGRDTVPKLVETLYAGLKPMLARAAALTVEAHLTHMMEDGRVRALADGRYELSAAR